MSNVPEYLIQIAVLMFSISVHESAHAWMADKFGDPTAKLQGRITLNPIPHIDLIGSIIVPAILIITGGPVFGWAKPVLVDTRNLNNPRKANVYISAAGPISNLLTALMGIVIYLALKKVSILSFYDNTHSISNLIALTLVYLIMINVILAFFNLIPIPPLDGSGILEGFLKGEALRVYMQIKPYGFFIFLFLFYTNVIDYMLLPIQKFVFYIITL